MDIDDLTCLCGRYFERPAALSNHRRSCKRTRRQLSDTLAVAKTLWAKKQARKLTQIEDQNSHQTQYTQADDFLQGMNGLDQVVDNEPQSQVLDEPTTPQSSERGESEPLDNCKLPLAVRRTRRTIRQPGKLRDMVPHPPDDDLSEIQDAADSVDPDPATGQSPDRSEATKSPTVNTFPVLCLAKDSFGVFRQYFSVSHALLDPDRGLSVEDLSNNQNLPSNTTAPEATEDGRDQARASFGPYPNKTSFLLAEWYWGNNKKSRRDFHQLLEIITRDDFRVIDVRQTPWTKIDKLLGGSNDDAWPEGTDASWIRDDLEIVVPFHRFQSDSGAVRYRAGHIFRRSLMAIIQEVLLGAAGHLFHFEPIELFWCPPHTTNQTPLRLYGELYNSPAFVDAYRDLQNLPHEPDCNLPRSVIALMFCSDETHLTQFGQTKLWPLYLFFGNISKYIRRKSGSRHCHHVAYFASLPENFEEFIRAHTGKGPTDSLQSFCNQEIYREQWRTILDDDFMEAYAHGFILKCLDGQTRRLYPRVFTLSADYKEKTHITCIRHLGTHPCPQCLVKLNDVYKMGTPEDRSCRQEHARCDDKDYHETLAKARRQIFEKRYAVKGAVDEILDPLSLNPNVPALSSHLSAHGFDVFQASVVDPLHDVEQGNWRALFIHLIRILYCEGDVQVIELNSRYRSVPTFGRNTVRKFRNNISEMRGLAGRDLEDMLQCSMPVFEGLTSEPHNSRILRLLFILAHWHGLAKLRLHTDATLKCLDEVTTELGDAMRDFKNFTCSAYTTEELPREKEARSKRPNADKEKKNKPDETHSRQATPSHAINRPPTSQTSEDLPRRSKRINADKKTQNQPDKTHGRQATPSHAINGPSTSQTSEDLPRRSKRINADKKTQNQPDETNGRQATPSHAIDGPSTSQTSDESSKSKKNEPVFKEFSLRTYKFHASGHYVDNIRRYGTTDSYSTEMGELEHRRSKSRYSRTNKKDFIKQMAEVERREARIQRIREHISRDISSEDRTYLQDDLEKGALLRDRYHLSKIQSSTANILDLIRAHPQDPAMRHFLPDLKIHTLYRIRSTLTPEHDGATTPTDQDISTYIQHDRLYQHKVLRINYTTYDLRRDQDVVNPDTGQCNVMVLRDPTDQGAAEAPGSISGSTEDLSGGQASIQGHPYMYARVIMIFHVNVVSMGINAPSSTVRMDVLWVRWYRHHMPTNPYQLDRLTFLPMDDEDAFGFIDPHDVIRAAHIIPAFNSRRRGQSEGGKSLSRFAKDEDDWAAYYVNRFVDRDMLMRYHGGLGVGHSHLNTRGFVYHDEVRIGISRDQHLQANVEDNLAFQYGAKGSFEPSLRTEHSVSPSTDGDDEDVDSGSEAGSDRFSICSEDIVPTFCMYAEDFPN